MNWRTAIKPLPQRSGFFVKLYQLIIKGVRFA
jgi:hypothetical protein